jgi:hypothetical protein
VELKIKIKRVRKTRREKSIFARLLGGSDDYLHNDLYYYKTTCALCKTLGIVRRLYVYNAQYNNNVYVYTVLGGCVSPVYGTSTLCVDRNERVTGARDFENILIRHKTDGRENKKLTE